MRHDDRDDIRRDSTEVNPIRSAGPRHAPREEGDLEPDVDPDAGERVRVDGAVGFAEDVHNRW